ncbi:rod shape-determining protein MreC [Helicobacter sp. 11S02629-2]|uniref:rod shape-determining protein MreC n=1 Tax=Helicobacter sp. 11S02629-2 TaxID=1476195 RepID=UPI000BA6B845|nr:rod shape-determining protein MreC [Helicobacter sp. 11S02629-2]PAF42394.1 hypothetical protein BKH40_07950 [Helicobacter sp. 11S02629-2]
MKILSFFIILIVLVVAIFGFVPVLRSFVITSSYDVKQFYVEKKQSFSDFVDDYTTKAAEVAHMRSTIRELQADKLKYDALKVSFDNLNAALNINNKYDGVNTKLAKVISYASLANYTRIWIDYSVKHSTTNKMYGILKDGYAMGIATFKDNTLLGFLNGDKSTSYSVYVGKNQAPGILRTDSDNKIVIDYIPSWIDVEVGDEVITSGLDGIFFEGIKVGKVTSVKEDHGYTKASVQVYSDRARLGYVWIVDTKVPQTIMLDKDSLEK